MRVTLTSEDGTLRARGFGSHDGLRPTVGVALVSVFIAILLTGCPQAERLAPQRDWVETHPQVSSRIRKAVLGKKLVAGMTKDAVIASWGEPTTTLRLGTADARWTYVKAQSTSGRRYLVEYTLVFKGDVLIGVHQQPMRR